MSECEFCDRDKPRTRHRALKSLDICPGQFLKYSISYLVLRVHQVENWPKAGPVFSNHWWQSANEEELLFIKFDPFANDVDSIDCKTIGTRWIVNYIREEIVKLKPLRVFIFGKSSCGICRGIWGTFNFKRWHTDLRCLFAKRHFWGDKIHKSPGKIKQIGLAAKYD